MWFPLWRRCRRVQATKKVERVLLPLLARFDDLASIDKVSAINHEVNNVKGQFHENVQKMVSNIEK